jgi:hypothetical protein
MSVGVLSNVCINHHLLQENDDDDAFFWLDADNYEDEEDEYDDDSCTTARYVLAQQTPNHPLYAAASSGPRGGHEEAKAIASGLSTTMMMKTTNTANPSVQSQHDGSTPAARTKKPSSYLPTFDDDDENEGKDDCCEDGDDSSIGFLVSTSEREREVPIVDDERRRACHANAVSEQHKACDVQTAIALVGELSSVLGDGAAAPLFSPAQSHREAKNDDAEESDLPNSPNSVLTWFPRGNERDDSKMNDGSIPEAPLSNLNARPTGGRPKRSASLDPAAMISHHAAAGPASSTVSAGGGGASVPAVEVQVAAPQVREEQGRNFSLLKASDRTHSMPARLAPPPSSARPKKSALKRTSSAYQSMGSGAACALVSSSPTCSSSTNDSTNNHGSLPSLKRNSVSFTNLEIREYSIALSDHPGCSYGPPIQLGWDYEDKEKVGVEEYEERRPPRRTAPELVLSYNVRRYLLLKRAGYSKSELQAAVKEVERVKRDRMFTDLLLPASKIDETLEEVIHSFRQILFPPPKKNREPLQQSGPAHASPPDGSGAGIPSVEGT